ncbi:hypothetical protein TNCV_3728351 [Trichonephila clavipes]|nr:hypothetical protein TNCV_3728351 [Trichonephila clavipes]
MGGCRSPKLQRQFVHLPCLQETDLKGMWGCLRSTDSMAGEAVSLHSLLPNRNCKIYRQNFEADDFPCGAVNLYKGWRANSRGLFTPSSSARKTLHCWEAHLLPEVNPIRRSLPPSKLSSIQLCVT